MTSPVSMMRLPAPSETATNEEGAEEVQEKADLTMCFYINEEFQNAPPTPSRTTRPSEPAR